MSAGAVLWVTLAVFAQESVWNFYDAQVPEQSGCAPSARGTGEQVLGAVPVNG